MSNKYDVVVIGAGPAGYVAAIRCAQLGLKTACVDDWTDPDGKPVPGGTCLNAGCIPSKSLLESSELFQLMKGAATHGIHADNISVSVAEMVSRKNRIVKELTRGIAALFKSNGIDWIAGRGQLLPDRKVAVKPASGRKVTLRAGHVILAPGSLPLEIDAAALQVDLIVDSTGALEWTEVPRRLGIIGAGVIGLELGSVWARLGAEVILLEAQDRFLSMADGEIAREALKLFKRQGLDIRLGTLLESTRIESGGIELAWKKGSKKGDLIVDRLIVAVGRAPASNGLSAAEAGLLLDEGRFVHVDEYCVTNLPGVYAIGDVVRGPMLAHKGSEEGTMVAERIAGQRSRVNYGTIASVIYTQPEIAWVGKTEEALKQEGIAYRSGKFPFAASGRARAMQATDGLVKVLSDRETDRVLGVHIMGAQASELIGQAVLAMEFEGTSEDIARTVFAHPTLSEALHEAALGVDKRALHVAVPERE